MSNYNSIEYRSIMTIIRLHITLCNLNDYYIIGLIVRHSFTIISLRLVFDIEVLTSRIHRYANVAVTRLVSSILA